MFVVGLDSEGDGDIASVPLRSPLALVVGAEGKGLAAADTRDLRCRSRASNCRER